MPGTGLGEAKNDRFTTAFRIFAEQATNDLSHSAWAPVGAAAQEDNINTVRDDRYTGRISAIVVDPSDPSGNTVYVGAASGGIWKTTNFLTKDPKGPTYVPLTDFGPTLTINIGSIVIYPRNNDPAQSIIFAVTGEGAHRAEDTDSSRGVGFIRSMDGGRTWTLLDSLANADANGNAIPLSLRDHWFLNTTGYKIAVDPQPTPTGEVIVYAALSDVPLSALNHGGIYRSMDTGKTWQLMRAGQATDVSLDMASGHMDAVSNPTGNLDILYAAFRGDGVYSSPNRGVVWNAMLGGLGDPLFRNVGVVTLPAIPVDAPAATPNGATKQRIHLVKPTPTGDSFKDSQYQGWLYVLVTSAAGVLENLYATKDFGQNWTMVHIPLGTNDHTAGNFQIFGSNEAESSSAIAVDPTNPNVLYIAGSIGGIQGRAQLMRIDLTALTDPHALYNADDLADNGTTRGVTGAITTSGGGFYMGATATPYLNLLRDPAAPFLSDSTLYLSGLPGTRFTNLGADAHTIPFDSLQTGDDNQIIVTSVDSLTGQPRLIVGSGTGIYTGVDDDGAYGQSIGTASTPFGFRGGNLQVNQFSFGAAQPSAVAAEAAGALFYGSADDFGTTRSSANVLNTGGISWQPEPRAWDASTGDWDPSTALSRDVAVTITRIGDVATDQTGSGTTYQYIWTGSQGTATGFFRVNGVARTFNLLQVGDDPDLGTGQWPAGPIMFSVNPVNKDQVVIGSEAGRVFATTNQGVFWSEIGNPGALDNSQIMSLAYGAPAPNDPVGGTNNFIYAGTRGGRVFVTYTGGGANGNQWINLAPGSLDGTPIMGILTNPLRGSREAYAITAGNFLATPPVLPHVYRMRDATAPGATWEDITGNLNAVPYMGFDDFALYEANHPVELTSLVADWRYVIPDNMNDPASPTHPALYVGGLGGVWRSLDNGGTWSLFPNVAVDGALRQGGFLPNVKVTDLALSQGNVDPTTGRAVHESGDPDTLMATTYGRGSFVVRLSPVIVPGSFQLDPADDSGIDTIFGPAVHTDYISNVVRPRFTGLSEQTAFGAKVRVTLVDVTDPNNPIIIGGFDGNYGGPTDVAANWTDQDGRVHRAGGRRHVPDGRDERRGPHDRRLRQRRCRRGGRDDDAHLHTRHAGDRPEHPGPDGGLRQLRAVAGRQQPGQHHQRDDPGLRGHGRPRRLRRDLRQRGPRGLWLRERRRRLQHSGDGAAAGRRVCGDRAADRPGGEREHPVVAAHGDDRYDGPRGAAGAGPGRGGRFRAVPDRQHHVGHDADRWRPGRAQCVPGALHRRRGDDDDDGRPGRQLVVHGADGAGGRRLHHHDAADGPGGEPRARVGAAGADDRHDRAGRAERAHAGPGLRHRAVQHGQAHQRVAADVHWDRRARRAGAALRGRRDRRFRHCQRNRAVVDSADGDAGAGWRLFHHGEAGGRRRALGPADGRRAGDHRHGAAERDAAADQRGGSADVHRDHRDPHRPAPDGQRVDRLGRRLELDRNGPAERGRQLRHRGVAQVSVPGHLHGDDHRDGRRGEHNGGDDASRRRRAAAGPHGHQRDGHGIRGADGRAGVRCDRSGRAGQRDRRHQLGRRHHLRRNARVQRGAEPLHDRRQPCVSAGGDAHHHHDGPRDGPAGIGADEHGDHRRCAADHHRAGDHAERRDALQRHRGHVHRARSQRARHRLQRHHHVGRRPSHGRDRPGRHRDGRRQAVPRPRDAHLHRRRAQLSGEGPGQRCGGPDRDEQQHGDGAERAADAGRSPGRPTRSSASRRSWS